jgi:hypothetical protein
MPEPGQDPDQPHRGITGFGVASAVLAVVALAASGLISVMWSAHHSAEADRTHQAQVLQAAARWTAILVNINADNVEASMAQLRDGTAGELNAGFDASIAPFRDVVRKLRSRTTGEVESVSIEATHQELDRQPGQRPPGPQTLPSELAARTDTVLVVATSVSQNAGTKPEAPPTTVRWNLRLDVSDVDGALKISRLESLR